jgi:hypothetical protein
MLKVAPPPRLFFAQSGPPWASRIVFDTARPIPSPFSLVVIKASKYPFGIFESRAVIDELDDDLTLLRSKHSQPNSGCICISVGRFNRIRDQVNKHLLRLNTVDAN